MNSKVLVVADATTNAVINVSANNPEYGYVRLQQAKTTVDDNGFLRRTVLSALIQAPVDILKEMGYYGGQILSGTLVIEESLTPFNKKNPERDLKIAGKTGIVCRLDDQPIYRRVRYSENPDALNKTIQHTNVEELREAYNMQSASAAIKPNGDFAI
jgi:hypothetical protein